MKIAQITPYFLPVEGGVERHVLNLSKELVRLGHEVDIFTCSGTRNGERLPAYDHIEGLNVQRCRSVFSLGEFGRVWPGFLSKILNGGTTSSTLTHTGILTPTSHGLRRGSRALDAF